MPDILDADVQCLIDTPRMDSEAAVRCIVRCALIDALTAEGCEVVQWKDIGGESMATISDHDAVTIADAPTDAALASAALAVLRKEPSHG